MKGNNELSCYEITKVRSLLLFLVFLVVVPCVPCIGEIFRGPTIYDVKRQSLQPPPGLAVNVTCRISHTRAVSAVVLHYAVEAINNSLALRLVSGDSLGGQYFGTIPPHQLGTVVVYWIEAVDVALFRSQTELNSYRVTEDKSRPEITGWAPVRVSSKVSGPITEFDEPEVRFDVRDSGSGVKEAVVYYDKTRQVSEMNARRRTLSLVSGDQYDGQWSGRLLPYPNGTQVFYFCRVIDGAGNEAKSDVSYYNVSYRIEALATFRVFLADVDSMNWSLKLRVQFYATLPSEGRPELIYATINYMYDNYTVKSSPLELRLEGGFTYGGEADLHLPLYGYRELYPFDYYFATIEIRMLSFFLSRIKTHSEWISSVVVSRQFDTLVVRNATSDSGHWYRSEIGVLLRRKPDSSVYLMPALYAVFLMFGSTALIPFDKDGVTRRITIYVALLTFCMLFYFTLEQNVPEPIRPSISQALVTSLSWSLAIASLISLFILHVRENLRFVVRIRLLADDRLLNVTMFVLAFCLALGFTSYWLFPRLLSMLIYLTFLPVTLALCLLGPIAARVLIEKRARAAYPAT